MAPLAVLGATGYTGRLVCAEARRSGVPLRLIGRDERKLGRLAGGGEEVRVANARDYAGLVGAFEGAFAVVSLAGPFMETGFAPVAAAIAAGAHYLDSTGEPAFARRVYDEYSDQAAARGVVLLTAFGFDYVPGDLAARLAAEGLEPLDEIVVGYSASGVGTSRGTRKTISTLAGRPHFAYEQGRLVDSRFGATTRRCAFPFGERDAVEWQGTEPLTVPRHTDVRNVRSYLRVPAAGAAAKAAPLAGLSAPFLRVFARVGGDGPSEASRRKSRFAVVAEARGPRGERRVALTGSDPYGLTARLLVRGAQALAAGEASGAGALAPAEAFDARAFAERLAPLLRVES
jgi:short subunit dehydrogenase-like uncharacterized protein